MMTSPERIPLQSLLGPGQAERLRGIASAVADGAIFVYPTETIYGIGGSYDAPGVEKKIFLAKKRASSAPLIIIAPDRKHFAGLPVTFPPAAEALARAFWPGMVTLVLPSARGPEGVAVRVSNHPFIEALFGYCGAPLFSTSANVSGEQYVNDPDLIFRRFSGTIDFMIDAGPLPSSLPSTVVRVGMDNTVEVVREGIVPAEDIVSRFAPRVA